MKSRKDSIYVELTKKLSFKNWKVWVFALIFVSLATYINLTNVKPQPTDPQIVKVSYTDREIFISTKTHKPVRQGIEKPGDILRIEFPHIKDANNNYIQLEGKYPLEFGDRVDMAKNLAVLYSIVTAKELSELRPNTRETVGNVTTIKYEK